MMLNKFKRGFIVLLILMTIVIFGCSGTAPKFSTFDSSDEGWTIEGDPDLTSDDLGIATPEYTEGYIWVNDSVSGGIMYWVAPQKYLDDKSYYSGKFLKFDLRELYRDGYHFPSPDVMLFSNDGTKLVYFDQNNYDNSQPNNSWNSYEIKLDSSAGWKDATGISLSSSTTFLTQYSNDLTTATDSQISSVLGSLKSLYIRAEFTHGSDTDALDNVYFGTTN